MGIEQTLSSVKSKDEMHRLIDALGEDAEAVLLVSKHGDGSENVHHWYTHFGPITIERAFFLAHVFSEYLMRPPSES